MPVISHGYKIPTMVVNRSFFPIGQKFFYSPMAEPGTKMLLVAEEIDGSVFPCTLCAIGKWCGYTDNHDENGINYIPVCNYMEREDKKTVRFTICQ